MNAHDRDDLRIAERAAEWHALLSRTGEAAAGPEDHAAFMAWLEESPRHVREFLLMQALDVEASGIDVEGRMDIDALVRGAEANVISLTPPGAKAKPTLSPAVALRPSPQNRRWQVMGIAASIIMVSLISWWALGSGRTYSTAVGELKTVQLSDGSIIHLNTASHIRVNYAKNARHIQLLDGEAMFKVGRDPLRPFRVQAGNSVIQAIGTQFNVNRRPSGTMVSVVEGAVKVITIGEEQEGTIASSAGGDDQQGKLTAGEEVRIAPDGRIEQRAPVDVVNIAAWQQHRLVFRDDTLQDIAAEFNRYNQSPKIIVEGATARMKRYGGIFDANDPQSIVNFISQDASLKIATTPTTIVVSAVEP